MKRVRLSPRDERRMTRAWRNYRRNILTPPFEADFRAEMALNLDCMSAEVAAQ